MEHLLPSDLKFLRALNTGKVTKLFYFQVCQCLEQTTTTSTTTTVKNGCGSPNWANDQWCDDENNNAGCNFDGGACCNNDFSGWNTYCQVYLVKLPKYSFLCVLKRNGKYPFSNFFAGL